MNINYRPEIDGLRAIAVISVILYHAQFHLFDFKTFEGGYIGVDIFFVISGYLITSIILKELSINGNFSFINFYKRRIKRIIPVLLFIILVSTPFAWFFLLPFSFIDFSKSILYSLGFSSNFYFHYSGLEYGSDVGALKPFLHTWSLSVEEQFYIFFPILLIFIYKFFRNYVILFLILGFIISLFLADWGSRNHPSFNFYTLPTRGWELVSGSILAYYELYRGYRSNNKNLNLILPILGLILIIYSVLFFNDEILHPSFLTLIPIIGVCLLIWFSEKESFISKILSSKIFVGIGLISYSLYLWHYPIFIFIESKYFFYENELKFLAILLSVFFSVVTYFTIEKYARFKMNFKILFTIISVTYFLYFLFFYIIVRNSEIITEFASSNHHHFLDTKKYETEHLEYKLKYDYDDFNERKNIFIVGNSYADDLLSAMNQNNQLAQKIYFYTPSPKKRKMTESNNYELECFLNFLKYNITKCKNFEFSSHLNKQYAKSDFIIFHQMGNSKFYEKNIIEIESYLKRDNKKFLILLDDVNGRFIGNMNVLDRFIYIFKKLPDKEEQEYIEKQFYNDSLKFDKKSMTRLIDILLEANINFASKRDIFCLKELKKCPMITDEGEKIYADYGHLTNDGAKYFSNKVSSLINRFEINYLF